MSAAAGRSSEVNVRVDSHRHLMRVALYLSEGTAQEAAGLIRTQGPAAATKLSPLLAGLMSFRTLITTELGK